MKYYTKKIEEAVDSLIVETVDSLTEEGGFMVYTEEGADQEAIIRAIASKLPKGISIKSVEDIGSDMEEPNLMIVYLTKDVPYTIHSRICVAMSKFPGVSDCNELV